MSRPQTSKCAGKHFGTTRPKGTECAGKMVTDQETGEQWCEFHATMRAFAEALRGTKYDLEK